MTEAEWLACTDPDLLLNFLRRRAGDRKFRLFACACCRRIWHLLDPTISGSQLDIHPRTLVEVAERCADGRADEGEWEAVQHASGALEAWHPAGAACIAAQLTVPIDARVAAPASAEHAVRAVSSRVPDDRDVVRPNDPEIEAAERATQARLVRDIFGHPFRPSPPLPPAVLAWNDGTVRRLAQAIYDDRKMPEGTLDPARLAVLADALLDAGCDDEQLIEHCRSAGPHVRGCWAIDLLLGKE